MSETQTMTAEQVRRAIAERLGWRIEYIGYTDSDRVGAYHEYAIYQHDKKRGTFSNRERKPSDAEVWKFGLDYASVPDWPNDDGAALALCLDVLDRLNTIHEDWEMVFTDHVSFNLIGQGGNIRRSYWQPGRDALSMARLALAALEGGDA